MADNPTANDVAIAIVAACRQTGEDPLAFGTDATMRARRYAFTVLAEQFPVANRQELAQLVGAPNVKAYWRNREPWVKISIINATKRTYLEMGGHIRGL